MLRRVDTSFDVAGARSYRAVNRDSFMVDLIAPAPKDPVRPRTGRSRIGGDDDLIAAEIFGLAWLVNSPGFEPMSIGEDGFPVRLACPDPRAFALHKLWLSQRDDREPEEKRRDRAQAMAVIDLLRSRLPNLPFDSADLQALPQELRKTFFTVSRRPHEEDDGPPLRPSW